MTDVAVIGLGSTGYGMAASLLRAGCRVRGADVVPTRVGQLRAEGGQPGAVPAAALQQFLAASGSGLGREDDAAVAKVCARNAGLTLPGGA